MRLEETALRRLDGELNLPRTGAGACSSESRAHRMIRTAMPAFSLATAMMTTPPLGQARLHSVPRAQ